MQEEKGGLGKKERAVFQPLFPVMEVTMENLKTLEGKVRIILEKNKDARDDDMVLYLALCNDYLANAGEIPLAEIMERHKSLGLPGFESVSRTRRRLQARYPELMSSISVQAKRAAGEKDYRRYSKRK